MEILRIAQNYAETVPFRKISTPGNWLKLRYAVNVRNNLIFPSVIFFSLKFQTKTYMKGRVK